MAQLRITDTPSNVRSGNIQFIWDIRSPALSVYIHLYFKSYTFIIQKRHSRLIKSEKGQKISEKNLPGAFFCMRTKKGAILTPFFIFDLFMSSY